MFELYIYIYIYKLQCLLAKKHLTNITYIVNLNRYSFINATWIKIIIIFNNIHSPFYYAIEKEKKQNVKFNEEFWKSIFLINDKNKMKFIENSSTYAVYGLFCCIYQYMFYIYSFILKKFIDEVNKLWKKKPIN